jgi:hypothetical protein
MKQFIFSLWLIGLSITSFAQQQDTVSKENKKPVMEVKHFNVVVTGGLSWRVAQTDPQANDLEKAYIKDLKSGKGFDIAAKYYFKTKFGVGVKFNTHLSKVRFDNLYVEYNNKVLYGTVSDDIAINTYAATFSGRLFNRARSSCFTFDGGIGLMTYHDDARVVDNIIEINGFTMGLNLSAGYAVFFNKNIGVTLGINYLSGVLTQYDYTENGTTKNVTLNENEYQGLNHFDVMGGLIIAF